MMESRHDHQMNHCQPKNDKLGIDKGIKCASQHKSAGEKKKYDSNSKAGSTHKALLEGHPIIKTEIKSITI